MLCFWTLTKYRLLTCMAQDSTQSSLNFIYSEWDADMCWERAYINLLTFIQSQTWKSVHELFLKESKAELLAAGFEYWKSFIILEKHSNTLGYMFSSCRKLEQPFLSFLPNIKNEFFLFLLRCFGILGPRQLTLSCLYLKPVELVLLP